MVTCAFFAQGVIRRRHCSFQRLERGRLLEREDIKGETDTLSELAGRTCFTQQIQTHTIMVTCSFFAQGEIRRCSFEGLQCQREGLVEREKLQKREVERARRICFTHTNIHMYTTVMATCRCDNPEVAGAHSSAFSVNVFSRERSLSERLSEPGVCGNHKGESTS